MHRFAKDNEARTTVTSVPYLTFTFISMSQQDTPDRSRHSFRFTPTFFANFVLHCLQVAGLIILVVRNRQHKALASWSGGVIPNLLSLKFNLLPSVIFKVYGILLAFLTQTLALKREACVKQTLTDIHDKTSAWMGEVRAIVALFRHNSLKGGNFLRIACVSLYLSCITVLCTAASSIVTYAWVPGDQTYLNITYLFPNITVDDVKDGYPALSILPVMDRIGVAGALGLWNNIVFDPPYAQDAIIDQVSAVKFDVNCQALPDAHQSGSFKVNTSTGDITFPFHADDTLQDVEFSLANGMINMVGANRSSNTENLPLPPTILLASTIPIVDRINGIARSISALDPPLVFPNCDVQNCLSQTQVQILACDMRTTFLEISVDGSNGAPVTRSGLVQPNYTWAEWTGPPEPQDSLETTLGAFAHLSPLSNTRYDITLLNESAKSTYLQTLLEESVMSDLGVEDVEEPASSLELSNVNLSLGRALALVYWRASLTLSGTQSATRQVQSSSPKQGSYEILVNSYTPFISLIASVLALILMLVLTWPERDPDSVAGHSVPMDLGVLQMFWRAGIDEGRYAAKLHSMVDVKRPTTRQLRDAGKNITMESDGSIAVSEHPEANPPSPQQSVPQSKCYSNASDSEKGTQQQGATVKRPSLDQNRGTEKTLVTVLQGYSANEESDVQKKQIMSGSD